MDSISWDIWYGQPSFIITMIVSWSSKFPVAPFFSPSRQVFLLHENPGFGATFLQRLRRSEHLPPFLPQFRGQKRVGHGDTAIFSYLFQLLTAPMAWQTFIFGGGLSSHILMAGQDPPPKRCKKNQVPGHWLPSALKLCLSNVFAQLGYVLRGLGTSIGYQKWSHLISLSAFLSRLVFCFGRNPSDFVVVFQDQMDPGFFVGAPFWCL